MTIIGLIILFLVVRRRLKVVRCRRLGHAWVRRKATLKCSCCGKKQHNLNAIRPK